MGYNEFPDCFTLHNEKGRIITTLPRADGWTRAIVDTLVYVSEEQCADSKDAYDTGYAEGLEEGRMAGNQEAQE